MPAEPFTYTAPCGCGHPAATYHATPAGSATGRDTTRVDCPGCGADPPEPSPTARMIGALRKALP